MIYNFNVYRKGRKNIGIRNLVVWMDISRPIEKKILRSKVRPDEGSGCELRLIYHRKCLRRYQTPSDEFQCVQYNVRLVVRSS